MKKILIALLVIPTVFFAWLYLFVSSDVNISVFKQVNCTATATRRFINDKNKWHDWWKPSSGNTYSLNGFDFNMQKQLPFTSGVQVSKDDFSTLVAITVSPVKGDASMVECKALATLSNNPLKRFTQYKQVQQAKKTINDMLDHFKSFIEKQENVYGAAITQIKVSDTLLISTKVIFHQYPNTQEIYKLIKSLRDYINEKQVSETGFPMMHIFEADTSNYEIMIAIPISKPIPDNNNFKIKRMVPGKILVSEVKGGAYTANHAFDNMQLYVDDYARVSPAIPFQSLITERINEPDTTKWVTKIYYPVY